MKKLVLILLSVFFVSGCIDYSSTVKLNSDGSGTIEETVLMSGMLIQMMNSFAQSFGDSVEAENEFDIFDEQELIDQAAEMGKGVKYLRGEKVTVEGKEGYKAYFSFENVNDLKLSDSPDEKIPADDMMMNEEDETTYITFNFSEGNPSMLEIIFPEEETEESEVEYETAPGSDTLDTDMMMEEQMKMLFRDFKVSMKMEFDGDIEETNASYVDGNKITFFEMDFAELLDHPEKYEKFKEIEPNSLSEVKDLLEEVPGFKVELNKKVYVKFD